MKPTVDIVIVNWNSGEQLRECLESIYASKNKDVELSTVTVVDNASSDGSLKQAESSQTPAVIIPNARNIGFGAACNQGAQVGSADYILFLNPDAKLYHDSLDTSVCFMEESSNSNIGIIGIQLLDNQGNISRSCSRFPTTSLLLNKVLGLQHLSEEFKTPAMNEWDHEDSRFVDQVIGAFFLVRRTVFEGLEGFDERFFVYYEEVDFSYRAMKSGWASYYLNKTKAFHKGGGTSENVKARRMFYSLRSRLIYCKKHFGFVQFAIITIATLIIEPITRLAYALFRRSMPSVQETLGAYLLLWRDVFKSNYLVLNKKGSHPQ